MKTFSYKIIVAAGQNNEIGDGENLLWHLPKDMRWFKEKTTGADVIMGRKTYESFPEKYRPLPNRTNIVITRNKDYQVPKEVLLCHSIEEAKTIAENCDKTEKYIIGGGTIYEQALDFCDEVLLTKVHAEFPNANTFFPTLDMNIWEETWRENHCADEKHAFDFSFIQYRRRSNK